jgi:hypothetical protein
VPECSAEAVIPSITGIGLETNVKTARIAILDEEVFSLGHIVIDAIDRVARP